MHLKSTATYYFRKKEEAIIKEKEARALLDEERKLMAEVEAKQKLLQNRGSRKTLIEKKLQIAEARKVTERLKVHVYDMYGRNAST